MGKFRHVFNAVAGGAAPLFLAAAPKGRIWILNYHRIHEGGAPFLLDDEVISASPALFEREVAWCARHFQLITFARLKSILNGEQPMPPRPMIITFDDGYEDNYRLAWPILKKHRVPAVFFVVTDRIGQKKLFWWDEAAVCFKTTTVRHVQIMMGGEPRDFVLDDQTSRRKALKAFLKILKTLPDVEQKDVLQQLTCISKVQPQTVVPEAQTMTWEQVRAMADSGMEIGSHTRTHPVLSRVADEDGLRMEIGGSKTELERRVGRSVTAFSYPVGGKNAVTSLVRDVVAQSGYHFAVTYQNGRNDLRKADPFMLRRLHVDGLDFPAFKTRVFIPNF